MTASQAAASNITDKITVTVKDQSNNIVIPVNGAYDFSSAVGNTYTVTYTVANIYYPAITASKTVTITVKDSTPTQP